ncbi:protein kinase [Corallococcus macrosporus]|uniref:Protein kinase n=1 Tax=Corallococcus macrosporus TaxID=35 RepID=A0ABS3D7A2_9BACT|nr:serine/threonine-protein kinase [Corallococcus macrosporus]MBN8227557.1 protein kinase [Corallococcus macrosporus]
MSEHESWVLEEARPGMPRWMGPYQVQGILGHGGMGIVYLGQHRVTGQRAALKTVRVTGTETLASLRREIQALIRIHHPGIVRILDHGMSGGLPWYAMGLLEGRTFRQVLEEHHSLSFGQSSRAPRVTAGRSVEDSHATSLPSRPLLKVVRQLCAPLAYLHGCGLVHCDLKPGNIFIQPDGSVVLGDFGVAALFGGPFGRESLQAGNAGLGTLLYMAPEQIRADLVDARADLYSLGCILYECVTGFVPFFGSSSRVIRKRHLREPPTPPSQLTEERLPVQLEWLILTLLAKQPEDRLGYADDVARALSELGVEAPEPAGLPESRPYLYRPLFTGREDTMRRLRERLARNGGGIFIGGGSGVGKTRLALELAREARARELPVVTCECIPLGLSGPQADTDMKAPPLHPFRPLLAAVADHCRQGGPEETARLLGSQGKVLVAYEPALEDLPGQRELPVPPPPANAAAARARIFAALREVLFAFAEEDPLLIIIDDLQWADEMSLGFLQQLRHEELVERGVLLLGTYRMEERGGVLDEVVSMSGALHLELELLDEQGIRSMVGGMLALHTLPKDFDGLVHQAEGNPFFIAEYLRAAITEGLLHRDEWGQWRLEEQGQPRASLDGMGLPLFIAEIIQRRLRDLPPPAQALMEFAAVLGRECDVEVLLSAAPLKQALALEALQTLRVRQILERGAGGRLRFLHDKLREISYARIPPERARQLHRRAAEVIEQRHQHARDFDLLFSSLANHWSRAGVPDRASDYFRRAADRARATHANGEAITSYRAALAEARAHRARAKDAPPGGRPSFLPIHESLADVLALTGRQEEARTAYGEALACLPVEGQVHRASILRRVGKTWETHHRHEEALRAYADAEAALGTPPKAEDTTAPAARTWWQEWLQLQEDLHWTLYWQDDREAMGALVERVRPVLETYGTGAQRARFFVVFANTCFRQERYAISPQMVEYGRLAVEAARTAEDLSTQALALFCHAFTLVLSGALDLAEEQGLAGLRLAEETGDLTLQSRLLTYLTLVYRRRGLVDRTRESSARSLDVAAMARMTDYVGAARASQAWVAWREQRLDDAEQEARAALECWRKLSAIYPYPFQWQGLWVLLAIALQRQFLTEAVEHARALLDPTQQRLPEALSSQLEKAIHVWTEGQRKATRESLERATASARSWRYL